MSFAIEFQVTHNARCLGGIPTSDGTTVRPGVLFRADALNSLTAQGLDAFDTHKIGTVVDLRTDTERARAADVLPNDGSVTFISLPIQGGAMDELAANMLPADFSKMSQEQLTQMMKQIPTLEDLYLGMLKGSAAKFAEIGRSIIAASDTDRPGVLFHCTAGKDRTGLTAALMLLIADAEREAIIDDYTITEKNLAGEFAHNLTGLITSLGIPLTPELVTLATKSPRSAIETVLTWLDTEHGGATGYLESGGLSSDEISQLRQVLRVPALSA